MIMKPRKTKTLKIQAQVRQLSTQLSFLDVLRDACAHNGRYTLTAESAGSVYTVLVDRGGPFNAIGGGTAGSPALVAAAQLRSGRCTITIGWPVDQPLYQPGLDLTLKALVEGAVAPSALPRHRGVDSLRNAEWRETEAVATAPQTWQRPTPPPAPPVMSVQPPPAPAPPPVYAPAPVEPVAMELDPLPAPAPAPTPVVPVVPVVPQPLPVETAFPTRPWVRDTASNAEVVMAPATDAVLPAREGSGAAVQTAKHFATQALLWLCEVDEPQEYTLSEAASLARHNLVEGISQGLHPFRREMSSKIGKVKEEWAKSGEVASRNTRKRRPAKATRPADEDDEFRLF